MDKKIIKNISLENNSLDRYYEDIAKENLLTVEEERNLALKAGKGDIEAENKLVKSNLRFVVYIAKKYQNQGIGLEDLIGAGNVGLIKATKKFNEHTKQPFIGFADKYIRESIEQTLAEDGSIVKRPLKHMENSIRINKAQKTFEQEFERKPSVEEVSTLSKLSEPKIIDTILSNPKHLSVDATLANGKKNGLLDVLQNENSPLADEQMNLSALKEDIKRAINILDKREKAVIKDSFGIDGPIMTMAEIGEKMGLKRERVRQIRQKALRHLRKASSNNILKSYLNQ